MVFFNAQTTCVHHRRGPAEASPALSHAQLWPCQSSSACGAASTHLACKTAATMSSPQTLPGRVNLALKILVGKVCCLPPTSPARLLPSLCSKRGGRLLSPLIPWPQISGGCWAAGRHRTDTCVPDLSSCARDTPSICSTSHVLLPVSFPGASWEGRWGWWQGGRE